MKRYTGHRTDRHPDGVWRKGKCAEYGRDGQQPER